MAIESVLLNVSDIERSVEFYCRHFDAVVIYSGADTADSTSSPPGSLLTRVDAPAESTWVGDDLQRGSATSASRSPTSTPASPPSTTPACRSTSSRSTPKAACVSPSSTTRTARSSTGQGPLQYHEVYDRDAVEQDWGLGDPERPRFDHVAETVDDLDATKEHYAKLGYDLMSGIHQPDDRGFEINFLRHGDSSLEIFTYDRAEKAQRAPQLDAPGFVAVGFGGSRPNRSAPGEHVGAVAGREVYRATTGLLYVLADA